MNQRHFSHIVPPDLHERQRLSNYIVGKFPFLETGSAAKKAIKKKQVLIDSRVGVTGDWVIAGTKLEYISQFDEHHQVDPAINILYEDDHFLILNKPPGLLSSGNSSISLQGMLKSYPTVDKEGALFYPYLVHRLDRQTCGLIIAARTIDARRRLGEMVENHQIIKRYSLIVEGHLENNIKYIDQPIDDRDAKTEILSITHLSTNDASSYIRVRLHSGRTHQIRRHFLGIGHPIVGDDIYNKEGLSFGRGLFLMADYLEFEHPITGSQVLMTVDLHGKFRKYLLRS
ncbi:MAG: 23S rRNA pseudouridine1911/1915/1917 synthase [Saprospiraceae bacterium]|jgi:23S rRNA pseudouridine1911/1915/1917 synthase|tara:strand:- start:1873 stop:2730 length:858 start_codon:yes stop_codon:yes gene_type:complete